MEEPSQRRASTSDAPARDETIQHPLSTPEIEQEQAQLPAADVHTTQAPGSQPESPRQTQAPNSQPRPQEQTTGHDPDAQGVQNFNGTADDATSAAIVVRGNLLRGMWNGYSALGRGRKWILLLRMFIGLAQIIPAIAVLALPTSLGNSAARDRSECDPEPIFVYLALHVVRVAASLPTDLYLSLSPHRSARERRLGSSGFAQRERRRQFGSIQLDRKASRFGDLLGFCHVILFAIGNYVVWSGTECSQSPADSVPLFWTSVSMLSITYLVILNIVFLIFMVVFFLPLLLSILSALGLQNRLPTRRIRPETAKVDKSDVDKVTKLVYYTPAVEEDPTTDREQETTTATAGNDAIQAQSQTQPHNHSAPPLTTPTLSANEAGGDSMRPLSPSSPTWRHRLLGSLLPFRRNQHHKSNNHHSSASSAISSSNTPNTATSISTLSPPTGLKYPLHPIPSHRATCPICLCDFEEPPSLQPEGEAEPEPLRLLPCNHVLHMSCVDEWLCTVSGRCPVCQKPILHDDQEQEGGRRGEDNA
ncbi:unnamed protein product [Sympodiomycopsis kandeliae]